MEKEMEKEMELNDMSKSKSDDKLTSSQTELTSNEVKGTILNMLDKSKKQKFHLTTILVSGVGFFTDAYDLFVIGLLIPILQYIYYPNNKMPALDKSILTASSLVGTLIGQAIFGYLGDRMGRKKVYGVTLIIMSICAVGSAFSFHTSNLSIVASLSIWRVMLGIGIGGDYPLSAVLTSEYANVANRGSQIAAVFAMQGLGQLVGAVTVIILLQIFPDPELLDYVWRMALAVGVIPALITIYFRFQIPETPRFLMDVKEDYTETVEAYNFLKKDDNEGDKIDAKRLVTKPKDSQNGSATVKPSVWRMFRENWLLLVGTASTWFLLDVAFYSQSLFQPTMLSSIQFFTSGDDIVANMRALALGQFCIALLGAIPGYWMTVGLVDRMGRRNIQLMGFALMTILYLILSVSYNELVASAPVAFVILYALTFFFTNFGPNATTFIIPSELFPTAFRSTGHGVSAACGKAGAILGAFGFAPLNAAYGLPACMGVFTGILFLGFVITWFLTPETAQKTLEELEHIKAPIASGKTFLKSCGGDCNCWITPRDLENHPAEKILSEDIKI